MKSRYAFLPPLLKKPVRVCNKLIEPVFMDGVILKVRYERTTLSVTVDKSPFRSKLREIWFEGMGNPVVNFVAFYYLRSISLDIKDFDSMTNGNLSQYEDSVMSLYRLLNFKKFEIDTDRNRVVFYQNKGRYVLEFHGWKPTFFEIR